MASGPRERPVTAPPGLPAPKSDISVSLCGLANQLNSHSGGGGPVATAHAA